MNRHNTQIGQFSPGLPSGLVLIHVELALVRARELVLVEVRQHDVLVQELKQVEEDTDVE
jgi:hypothetical protein